MVGLSSLRSPARVRFAAALALLLGCALGGPLLPRVHAQAQGQAQAQPQADEESEDPVYRQAIDDAVREFTAGHWEEARALFKNAHERSPNARTLRGMGMAAYELRMYVQAMRELDASLKDPRKPLDPELRKQVQTLMNKAREFVGRVHLVLQPKEAKPLIDGEGFEREPDGSVLLDVGTHVVSATASGYKPVSIRFNVEGGSEQSLRVALEPLLALQPAVPAIDAAHPPPQGAEAAPPPPSSQPVQKPARQGHLGTYAWIALAGAGAFGITSAVFWLVGEGQYKDLKGSCAPACSEKQISDSGVKTSDVLTNVFLGAAAVSALTSGVLFTIEATRGGEHKPPARAGAGRPALALDASPGGVQLRGTF